MSVSKINTYQLSPPLIRRIVARTPYLLLGEVKDVNVVVAMRHEHTRLALELVLSEEPGVTVVGTVSEADLNNSLIAAVQALVDSGSLNGGQGNALITKLEHAADYVDSGQEAQAISKMQTFINQV